MSRPSAGNYIIYSRVFSPTGQKLAITFHGNDQYATVEPFGNNPNQVVRNPFLYSACIYSFIIRIDY